MTSYSLNILMVRYMCHTKKNNLLLSVMCQYIHCGLILCFIRKKNKNLNLNICLMSVLNLCKKRSIVIFLYERKPSSDVPDSWANISWSCPKFLKISYLPIKSAPICVDQSVLSVSQNVCWCSVGDWSVSRTGL